MKGFTAKDLVGLIGIVPAQAVAKGQQLRQSSVSTLLTYPKLSLMYKLLNNFSLMVLASEIKRMKAESF